MVKTRRYCTETCLAETYRIKGSCNRYGKDGKEDRLQVRIPFKTGDTLFVKHVAAAEQHLFFHAKMLAAD